jgi:dihydroorotase-like cyclic amidohydrolase
MADGDMVVRDAYVLTLNAVVDIGVESGTITVVGDVETAGRRELNADVDMVFPRFVDAHVHFD